MSCELPICPPYQTIVILLDKSSVLEEELVGLLCLTQRQANLIKTEVRPYKDHLKKRFGPQPRQPASGIFFLSSIDRSHNVHVMAQSEGRSMWHHSGQYCTRAKPEVHTCLLKLAAETAVSASSVGNAVKNPNTLLRYDRYSSAGM